MHDTELLTLLAKRLGRRRNWPEIHAVEWTDSESRPGYRVTRLVLIDQDGDVYRVRLEHLGIAELDEE